MSAVSQGFMMGMNNMGNTLPAAPTNTGAPTMDPTSNGSTGRTPWITPWKQAEWNREDRIRYETWAREDALNAIKQQNADTAIQRKFADAKRAGINPYFAMMGNAAGAAQPVLATSGGNTNTARSDTGDMIKGIIGVIATIATAGIAAKVSMSKQAKTLEYLMQKSRRY